MGRTLNRVAGVVFAGALITFAATPAALAQDETSTSPTETSTSTSETTTSSSPASTTSETTTAPPTSSTAPVESSQPGEVKTTEKQRIAPELKEETQAPPKDDDYQDGVGHGFVGLSGEGILVVACASGKVGAIYTQNLSVTAGPDQDESDGRLWNYTVTVVTPPTGPTGRFAFTCDGVEGIGIIDFEQVQPPATTTTTSAPSTTTSAPSSTAPITTGAPSTTTTTAPGNAAPKAQVKVAPKGGVETGFGGMAW